MNLRFATFALLAFAFALTACGRLGALPGDTESAGDESPNGSASSGTSAPEGIPDAVWAAILADLERETGRPSDPEVVSAEAVTWNDGSLGCPEAGQAYTQALVEGYQVVLEVDGERYDYRVGSGPDVKLCEGGALEGGG